MQLADNGPVMSRVKILIITGGLAGVLVLLGLLAVFKGVWATHSGGFDQKDASRGSPGFRLPDATGRWVSLDDEKGSTVLLHFWASWCPPCITELPRVLELAQQLKGRPFKVVLVSLDESWKDASRVLPGTGLPDDVISLIDPSLKVAESYGSYQFPETYLIDRRQKTVMKWVGIQDWASEPIHKLLERVIATP
jgi:thiol-disulfide isomerase/thioredoxin